jgi:hypothetical protein
MELEKNDRYGTTPSEIKKEAMQFSRDSKSDNENDGENSTKPILGSTCDKLEKNMTSI